MKDKRDAVARANRYLSSMPQSAFFLYRVPNTKGQTACPLQLDNKSYAFYEIIGYYLLKGVGGHKYVANTR